MKFTAALFLLALPTAQASDLCSTDAECGQMSGDCTRGICLNGVCELEAINAGGVCDDGNGCTTNGFCDAQGMCQEGVEDCSHMSGECFTGFCNINKECEFLVTEMAPCDDLDPCTTGDVCDATGVCVGTPKECCSNMDCSQLNTQCTEGKCDASGFCYETALVDYNCDDGDACTLGDTCNGAGECVGGSTVDCSTFFLGDGQCSTGVCDKASGACVPDHAAPGTECDDGDACTIGDTCMDGVCQSGPTPDCTGFGDECNIGYCEAGACVALAKEGFACDDNDPCTEADVCSADGVCGGSPKCAPWSSPETCVEGICNMGTCETAPIPGCVASCNDPALPILDPTSNMCVSCLWGTWNGAECVCQAGYCHGDIGQCNNPNCTYEPPTMCDPNSAFPLFAESVGACVTCGFGTYNPATSACDCSNPQYCPNTDGQCIGGLAVYDFTSSAWYCPDNVRRNLRGGDN